MAGRKRHGLAAIILCALSAGCVDDDRSQGELHAAVSHCLARYPFRKGTAYDRFTCITGAHLKSGPNAVGVNYDLISQIDMASLRIGLDVDTGTLSVPEAERELHWVTTKAQEQAARRSNPDYAITTQPRQDGKGPHP
ncbi:hypothetical protein [Gluconacetobacter takamatsuzukensis]|uniref:Lipoprotein n=1 Tax=Gluconacetobacter takamatsuzukensis TaxID=1286190 RepID=A0A7W4KFE0_9PROT|nr:hypothetical protein [Gluconacetobacter takamatsuzukensis]MBB2205889.1 hypothetical protein [Gluconacetobacter takamatsuzukensis]